MPSRILQTLEAETRSHVSRAEEDALAFVADGCAEQYRDYLIRCYGFEAPFESASAMSPTLASRSATTRPRTRYIAHDLVELGLPAERLLELKPCPLAPFRDLDAALGCLYVIERNVMTNALCYGRLCVTAPALAQRATYLNCYGRSTAARWRTFGISFERAVAHADLDRITTAAIESFERLHAWLQPDVPTAHEYAARVASSS